MALPMFGTARSPASVETILVSAVARYTLDALLDSSQRKQQREAERLKLHRDQEQEKVVKYADQAVLANLGWGIDALDEAIQTSNVETKITRLEYAEKMLQVCALLDLSASTGGTPNAYLAASAHLNLAFLWKLRNDDRNAAKHILEMFLADPFSSRVDFAPSLWEALFQPHLTGITSWYAEQRAKLMYSEAAGFYESVDFSYSRDDFFGASVDDYALNNVLSKVTAEQTAQLQVLEKLYQSSLDNHTRQYAKYYKDWLLDPNSPRKVGAMLPIAEPPMTPLHYAHGEEGILPSRTQLGVIQELEPDENRYNNRIDRNKDVTSPRPEPQHVRSFSNQDRVSVTDRSHKIEGAGKAINEFSRSPSKSHPSRSSSLKKMKEGKRSSSSRSSSYSTSSEFSGHDTPKQQKSLASSCSKGGFSGEVINLITQKRLYSPLSTRSENDRRSRTPRSVGRTSSKRLSEFFQENVTSLQASTLTSAASSGYATEVDSDSEMKEQRTPVSAIYQSSPEDLSTGIINHSGAPSPRSITESSFATYETDFDDTIHGARKLKPPKDFVCPITNQLFDDPVTLETGQTYERTAIQEWLERGNTTCPITRQPLKSRSLPQTNYVLKRVVENWKELHPGLPTESPLYEGRLDHYLEERERDEILLQHSPNSVVSASSSRLLSKGTYSERTVDSWAAGADDLLRELKPAVGRLCISEDLQECEEAVMAISSIWEKSRGDYRIEATLTKGTVIEALVEVLSASVTYEVQNASVCILSALVSSDEFTRHTILRADPELESIERLLKLGVSQAIILLYQLKLDGNELSMLDLVGVLVKIIKNEAEHLRENGRLNPKTAAVFLLQQLVLISPEKSQSNAHSALSLGALPVLIENLKAKDVDERLSTISILLCCIYADGSCRNLIAESAHLDPVVELLVGSSGCARKLVTMFFTELVHSNRRTYNNEVLKSVRKGGMLCTMHYLLVQLQKASLEIRPTIAMLILQLELVDEPRKQSVYREEAMQALVAALQRDSFETQVETAEALLALVGRLSYTGTCLTEPWLLKTAGLEQAYEFSTNEDPRLEVESQSKEEKAAKLWEFNLARVLLEYEQGAIFEAVGVPLQSKNVELSKPSMVMAVWMCRMAKLLPDMGVRQLARRYFMAPLVVALESAKHSHQRVLAALGLHTFLSDPESFQELVCYAKDIIKPLRQLKKITWVAQEFIDAFIKASSLNPMDLWQHGEIGLLDVSRSGEVRALARTKGRLFSGHSDGSIQVWETRKKVPTLLAVLKEHSKSVTSLIMSSSNNRLYSGSLDKTVRVWTIAPDNILCTSVLDVKEAVSALAVSGSTITVTSPGNGVKVLPENKQLNTGKHVQCLAIANGNIYCGCIDNSIQEVDIEDGSVVTIQSGVRTLLGRKPIYAIQVFKSEILSAGPPVDGTAVKIWDKTDYSLKRTLPTNVEIRAIAVNDDFLYLGSSSGCIEVWLKERNIRVSVLATGSKLTSLVLDGDILYSGTEDGKIRAWSFV